MKTFRTVLLASILALPAATLAEKVERAPEPSAERPATLNDAAIKSPRDPASGQATGKRQHKPIRFRAYYDQAAPLSDGRLLLVNTKTGENELGDVSKAGNPPTGEALPNGIYKMKDGTPLVVKGGLVVKVPPPTPTPFPVDLGKGVPDLR